ncbi:MAG: hypothetical protein M5U28_25470 [Sandaracinaceae bacterium]|nr:hypothetical protein [Sandaracinaceae bacterium]
MGNFFKDNDDLQFYFERGVDWRTLAELTEHRFRAPDGPKSAEEAVELYREVAGARRRLRGRRGGAARRADRSGGGALRGRRGRLPRAPAGHLRSDQGDGAARPVRPARARRDEQPADALLPDQRGHGPRRRLRDGAPRLPRRDGHGHAHLLGPRGDDHHRSGRAA